MPLLAKDNIEIGLPSSPYHNDFYIRFGPNKSPNQGTNLSLLDHLVWLQQGSQLSFCGWGGGWAQIDLYSKLNQAAPNNLALPLKRKFASSKGSI